MDGQTPSTSSVSLLISSLGWILLVVAVVGFFTIGQSHYYKQGYNTGVSDQKSADEKKFNEFYGLPTLTETTAPLTVKILSINAQDRTLQVEGSTEGVNPFSTVPGRQWTIQIDDTTKLTKQIPKLRTQVEQEIKDAASKGDSGAFVMPYTEMPLTLSELQPGDVVNVFANVGTDKQNDTFTASQVVFLVNPNSPQG